MEFDYELDYSADIATYRRTRERLCKARGDPKVEAMIRDVDYILEWLETGRRPGNKRGIERLAAYQREIPTDLIEKYMQPTPPFQVGDYEEWQYVKMEYILAMLSDRERECYELHIGGMMTDQEIADMLGIKRRTVREFLLRAEKKVQSYRKKPMPLSLNLVV